MTPTSPIPSKSLGVLFNTDRLTGPQFLEYAHKVEALGYESLWLPELFTRDPFAAAGVIIGQTTRLKVATGIANIYTRDPVAMVSSATALQELSAGRFILGLGVSNASLNKARGHNWQPPVQKIERYLDAMKKVQLTSPATEFPVHVAAHGPKMLASAAAHADGVNTYLMPLAHVDVARAALGTGAELNTMLFCLNEQDPNKARDTARRAIKYYLGLDYYHRTWRNFGFGDQDFQGTGSDRLIDAVVAWGSTAAIGQRINQQFEHGASRVVIIPIGAGLGGQPDWELLSAVGTVS